MEQLIRNPRSPVLKPQTKEDWQAKAAFNPCVIKHNNQFVMLYRAMSESTGLSTIGYAQSQDGISFTDTRQFIIPENSWEKFGCEDPRVTFLNGKFYIFYTALCEFPFNKNGIKVGLAITKDFQTIDAKHLITPFNAKAMTLFPELINGKLTALLTVDTDSPPPKISLAVFDQEEDLWSESYWNNWYSSLNDHVIPLLRCGRDYIEVGAPPVKTDQGWLLIYSYMKDFYTAERLFTIEALLLDQQNPKHIIGRTHQALLEPKESYELEGLIKEVVFPSGAILENDTLLVYYGAADTVSCLAKMSVNHLLKDMTQETFSFFEISPLLPHGLRRWHMNPILSPRTELNWEEQVVFNPAALHLKEKVYLLYRAMSVTNTSVLGLAISSDGIHFDNRFNLPVYVPKADFEKPQEPDLWSGCEDPRLVLIEEFIYMTYTGFDGITPRICITRIHQDDFTNQHFAWEIPKVISRPDHADKNCCLFPRKIQGRYALLHRPTQYIHLNWLDDLQFKEGEYLEEGFPLEIGKDDSRLLKVGIGSPPHETKDGWLLFYHRVLKNSSTYQICATLLDLNDPTKMISEKEVLLLTPEKAYELYGKVPNVVFTCGSVIMNKSVYLYYGAADTVIGLAYMDLDELLLQLC